MPSLAQTPKRRTRLGYRPLVEFWPACLPGLALLRRKFNSRRWAPFWGMSKPIPLREVSAGGAAGKSSLCGSVDFHHGAAWRGAVQPQCHDRGAKPTSRALLSKVLCGFRFAPGLVPFPLPLQYRQKNGSRPRSRGRRQQGRIPLGLRRLVSGMLYPTVN